MSLDAHGLTMALQRLSETKSVFSGDRVCVAAAQGRPILDGHAEIIVHWTGSGLPWFLRPLGPVVVPRWFVEITGPTGVLALARQADRFYEITVYSFPRALLAEVVSHIGSRGSAALEIAEHDPTYAELICDGDSPGAEGWLVMVRHNRDCPSDPVECLDSIYDLEGE